MTIYQQQKRISTRLLMCEWEKVGDLEWQHLECGSPLGQTDRQSQTGLWLNRWDMNIVCSASQPTGIWSTTGTVDAAPALLSL